MTWAFLKMPVVFALISTQKLLFFHCSHANLGRECVVWKETSWCETNLKWIGAMIWTLFLGLVIIGNAVIDMLCLHWPLRVRQLAEGVGEAYLRQTVSVLSILSFCQRKVSSNFPPWLCLQQLLIPFLTHSALLMSSSVAELISNHVKSKADTSRLFALFFGLIVTVYPDSL